MVSLKNQGIPLQRDNHQYSIFTVIFVYVPQQIQFAGVTEEEAGKWIGEFDIVDDAPVCLLTQSDFIRDN
jgi:hypothetical protein